MSCLEVGLVRVDIRVHLEDEDVSRIVFVNHGVQGQHTSFELHGRFDLLFHGCLVGL